MNTRLLIAITMRKINIKECLGMLFMKNKKLEIIILGSWSDNIHIITDTTTRYTYITILLCEMLKLNKKHLSDYLKDRCPSSFEGDLCSWAEITRLTHVTWSRDLWHAEMHCAARPGVFISLSPVTRSWACDPAILVWLDCTAIYHYVT